MSVLSLLIGISLVVIALVIWLFFRMSQTGQFEDMETPARRIILDDDRGETSFESSSKAQPAPAEADLVTTSKGPHGPPNGA
ncbi:MAG: Cytochrome oxidase maturation protein cbb3-type [Pseudomonadota bacterium]